MENKLMISPSPHITSPIDTQKIMLTVVAAMVPTLIASVVIFGTRALLMYAVCIGSSVVFEYIYERLLKRSVTISDCSAIVTGILIAFNVPVTLPLWMAAIGCFVAIVVAKQLFGGIGRNFANPAILARIVLLISFTQAMTKFVTPAGVNGSTEQVVGATPLALIKYGRLAELPSYTQMFLGMRGGSLGETCILTLLIGGIFLMVIRVITPTIPVVYLCGVFVLSWALGADPIMQFLSGGVVLGAFFMATDYVTSPTTEKGKFIFALGCAIITVVIRQFGSYPEGCSFSILLMNILTPHIDRLTAKKSFGGAK